MRFFGLFIAAFTAQTAFAFINIEEIRLQRDEGVSGSLNAQFAGQSGNTQKLVADFSTLNLYRHENWEYIGLAKYRYGESRHVKDTHEGHLHGRVTRVGPGVLSHEGFVQTEFSEFRQVKRRDVIGGGERIKIFRAEGVSLYFGAGAFYEHELFNAAPWSDETVRGSFYLSHALKMEKGATFTLTAYYQPSVEAIEDYKIQLDSGFSIPMVEKLDVTLEYSLQKDSRPASGVEPVDMIYLAGISWSY